MPRSQTSFRRGLSASVALRAEFLGGEPRHDRSPRSPLRTPSRHAGDYERRAAEFRLIEDFDPYRDEPGKRVGAQAFGGAPIRRVGSPKPRTVRTKASTV